MDPFLSAALVLAAGLAYCAYRQRRSLKAHRSVIAKRDAEIGRLKSQLTAVERENADSRALYSTNLDVVFDLLLLLDENLTLAMVNRPAARLFAGPDPIGKRLSDVTDSSELLNLVQVALLEEESVEEQFVIMGSNYRARAQVINYDKGRRYVGVALQDITDLVNLNRARRDLVANISHELRTPITRIRLIIEGLFLEADKPKRKASIQSLKEIAMETDALLWLAQDLLDLSMIESGEAILRLVKTPLRTVVDEAMERLESQAAMKELTIVSHVPQKYDVLCDADQLKRVFGNLIHNAIKWSPKGEAITITAAEQAEEITVSVFDNGPGVPEDLRRRVFERFYQADLSRSGDEGAGLGLAICKHIIEAHGGRIWAEGNSQGNGGHFLFTLLKADASFQHDVSMTESDPPREAVSEPLPLN
ncbi:MAG: HAMP domain-containing sensor histidine kinase [Chloroflexota bacterium]|nr:HAMP domain-containing sensor histidine kinase [Chloroflexota bacterium]